MNSATNGLLKRLCVCCVVLGLTASFASASDAGYDNGDGEPWWESLTVGFDLTLRQMAYNSENSASKGTRQLSEYQAIVDFKAPIQDNVNATIQIASGYGSAPRTSNFEHFGGKFDNDQPWIRQAYVDWQPTQLDGTKIYGGKMPNLFKRVGGHHGNQLLWDYDVMLEGAAGNYVRSLDGSTTFNANAGAFWVEEAWGPASGTAGDIMLYAGQAYLDRQFDETSHALAGASFYSYSNIINQPGFAMGNSETSGMLVDDYDLLEVFAQYWREISGRPCSLFGSWVNNTAASISGEDTAWIIGGIIEPCPLWTLGYDYRDVEADAVVGLFTDNYFVKGGTGANGMGSRGHSINATYQCSDNIELAARLILSEDRGMGSGMNEDFNLLFVDLVFHAR